MKGFGMALMIIFWGMPILGIIRRGAAGIGTSSPIDITLSFLICGFVGLIGLMMWLEERNRG